MANVGGKYAAASGMGVDAAHLCLSVGSTTCMSDMGGVAALTLLRGTGLCKPVPLCCNCATVVSL